MKSLKLKKDLYWNGAMDPDVRVTDVIVETKYGTTYNSYTLKGSEKTAVFESSKFKFWDEYKKVLSDVVDINDIDYIIMNHTEPDHSGTIEKMIELNPKITVIGTGTAISFLKEIMNKDFHSMIVKEGDKISLGDKTLQFMPLPNLHWPDTMFTYWEEENVLFTCDVFGAHYCPEKSILRSEMGADEVEKYVETMKYYFDMIIGPFKNPFMSNALERIKDLQIDLICVGHGPILDSRQHIDEVIDSYKEWCALPEEKENKLVVMPYVTSYGYTKVLGDKIKEGLEASGNIEVVQYDMGSTELAEVLGKIAEADGVLFGTPTIVSEALAPILDITTRMFPPTSQGKYASAFGCYGWSGEGVPHLIERLKQLRMKVSDGFRVRFKPSEVDLIDAYDFGYNFGCNMLDRTPEKKNVGGSGMVKCIVCGEVFDDSIEICPVCGAGQDKFVPVEDTKTSFRNDTKEQFLILGGGPAGLSAAKAIRERNKTAGITMVTDEAELPYNRPMLTKALLSDFSEGQFNVEPAEWYKENNIIVAKNISVTGIDSEGKKVLFKSLETGNEGSFSYDKLIYTLGAYCFVPPIKGSDQDHVVTIRNIADTQNIQKLLKERDVKDIICIGGGVMGLEGAWDLLQGGYNVTVLEGAPGLLPKQLDDPASEMLETICNKEGLKIVTGAATSEITENEVILADGTKFPAQLVVMSTGMRPHVDVAKSAGIEVGKLVEVDGSMRTNVKNIFAAGDCIEVYGQQQAFWAQALETGRIAGASASGEFLRYEALGASLVINAMNTSIFSLGTNGKDPDRQFRTVEFRDDQRNNYEKYYFHNNRLEGVILIGDTSRMIELTDLVTKNASFKEVFDK